MTQLADALNLLPASIADDRAKHFIRILWWMCCNPSQLDVATMPPLLIPYKLNQFGLRDISGLAARLPVANQRQLLIEAPEIVQLSGTPYSIKRVLELFEYSGVTFNENPTIDTIKRWGEFELIMQQTFRYSEVEAIVNFLKPPSRKLIAIRNINAILLNASRLLDGSSILEGLESEPPPIAWLDPATALTPVASQTALPTLVAGDSNLADNFNAQLQALINRIKAEDNALIAASNRIIALNAAISALGGGSIAPQLQLINAGVTTLNNSNQLLLNRLQQLTPLVGNLTTKTNTLEADTATITAASNARQLDTTVQRRDADLDAIAALASTAPFPANQVIGSTAGNNIAFRNIPALGAFMPQFALLEFKQPAGTNAGNYTTADVWAAMPFTIASNDDGFVVSVSASRFTIPPGTYIIFYEWQCCGGTQFGGRIWNQTSSNAIEQGSPGSTALAGGSVGDTFSAEGSLIAVFSVTANTNIEFQFRAKALHPNGAALTAGQSTANNIEQVYQNVVIQRISN